MPDPFAIFDTAFDLPDPFRALGPISRAPRRRERKEKLSEEEKRSLLKELASPAISGLAYLGETLDKPGAAVRGLLAGKPSHLLNLVPFSDYLGITDPKERVSGRKLLEGYGALSRNRPGLDLGDVAGVGAEIVLDPLTWVGIPGVSKALTASGKAAEKAGLLRHATRVATEKFGEKAAEATATTAARKAVNIGPREAAMRLTPRDVIKEAFSYLPKAEKKVAQREAIVGFREAVGGVKQATKRLDEPMGGLIGLSKFPMGPTWKTFSPGGTKAARAFDIAGSKVRYSVPVRLMASLVHGPSRGAWSELGQRTAKELSEAALPAERVARDRLLDNAIKLHDLKPTQEQMLAFIEEAEQIPAAYRSSKLSGQLTPELQAMASEVQPAMAARRAVEVEVGARSPELRELQKQVHGYMPRELYKFPEPLRRSRWPRITSDVYQKTIGAYAKARDKLFRGHPGGTTVIQELSIDPKVSGVAWQQLADGTNQLRSLEKAELRDLWNYIVSHPNYARRLDIRQIAEETLQRKKGFAELSDAEKLKRIARQEGIERKRFVKALTELDPRYARGDTAKKIAPHPYYRTDAYDVLLGRERLGEEAVRTDAMIHNMLAHGAVEAAEAPQGMMSLDEALHKVGLRGEKYADVIEDEVVTRYKGQDFLARRLSELKKTAPLKEQFVPRELVEEMARVRRPLSSPEEISRIGEGLDSFMNWWRAMVTVASPIPGTPPWPAFHSRNLGSGQIQNALVSGANPIKVFGNGRSIYTLLKTGRLPNAAEHRLAKLAGITDPQEASRFLAKEMAKDRVFGSGIGMGLETAGERTHGLAKDVAGVEKGASFLETIKGLIPKTLEEAKPWAVTGVGGRSQDVYAGARVGRIWTHDIEAMNRGGLWLTLTDQGYSAAEAARKVKQAHVAYTGLTQAERQARRVIPFWTFVKGMSEFLFDELMHRPGGPIAQTMRVAGGLRERDPFVPDYLSQGLTIPIPEGTPLIGPKPGGDPRYFSAMGFMHEDPLQLLGGGPGLGGTLRGLFQEVGSRSAPWVKGPVQWATGTSLFQAGPRGGRLLEDQDPLIGRILANLTGRKRPVTFPGSALVEEVAAEVVPRPLTTARTLTDPRKRAGGYVPGPAALINVLTGARVHDLPQATLDKLIGGAIEQSLLDTGAARIYKRPYVPKEVLAELPEYERKGIERSMGMMAFLGERNTQRAEGQRPLPLRTW